MSMLVVGSGSPRPKSASRAAANTVFRLVGLGIDAALMTPVAVALVAVYLVQVGHLDDFMESSLGLTGVFLRVSALVILVASALLAASVYRLLAHPTTGKTVGEKVIGVRCVTVEGAKLTWRHSLRRQTIPLLFVILAASVIALVGGPLAAIPDLFSGFFGGRVLGSVLALTLVLSPFIGLLYANFYPLRGGDGSPTLMDRVSSTRVVADCSEAEV